MDVLYEGLGILKQDSIKFFSISTFFPYLAAKTRDPDWIRIRNGFEPKMLDLDLDPVSMNQDPKH
jgi:hypothetical protein